MGRFRLLPTLLLPFILATAACNGGCAASLADRRPSAVASLSAAPPEHNRAFEITEEARVDDQAFDNFLADGLKRDESLSAEDQEKAHIIRQGILFGTLLYLLSRQDPNSQAQIMAIAKAHMEETAKFYARRRHELGLDKDDAPSTPDVPEGSGTSSVTPSPAPVPHAARPLHPLKRTADRDHTLTL